MPCFTSPNFWNTIFKMVQEEGTPTWCVLQLLMKYPQPIEQMANQSAHAERVVEYLIPISCVNRAGLSNRLGLSTCAEYLDIVRLVESLENPERRAEWWRPGGRLDRIWRMACYLVSLGGAQELQLNIACLSRRWRCPHQWKASRLRMFAWMQIGRARTRVKLKQICLRS